MVNELYQDVAQGYDHQGVTRSLDELEIPELDRVWVPLRVKQMGSLLWREVTAQFAAAPREQCLEATLLRYASSGSGRENGIST
jgi:hypothetical protein